MRHEHAPGRNRSMATNFHMTGQIDRRSRTNYRILSHRQIRKADERINQHDFVDPCSRADASPQEMQTSCTESRVNTPPKYFFYQHPPTDFERLRERPHTTRLDGGIDQLHGI